MESMQFPTRMTWTRVSVNGTRQSREALLLRLEGAGALLRPRFYFQIPIFIFFASAADRLIADFRWFLSVRCSHGPAAYFPYPAWSTLYSK